MLCTFSLVDIVRNLISILQIRESDCKAQLLCDGAHCRIEASGFHGVVCGFTLGCYDFSIEGFRYKGEDALIEEPPPSTYVPGHVDIVFTLKEWTFAHELHIYEGRIRGHRRVCCVITLAAVTAEVIAPDDGHVKYSDP